MYECAFFTNMHTNQVNVHTHIPHMAQLLHGARVVGQRYMYSCMNAYTHEHVYTLHMGEIIYISLDRVRDMYIYIYPYTYIYKLHILNTHIYINYIYIYTYPSPGPTAQRRAHSRTKTKSCLFLPLDPRV